MSFFSAIRPLFGGKLTQEQVDGLNSILAATDGLPVSHRAYVLATAHHETGKRMQPVREAFGESDHQTVARLDKAWADGHLGQVSYPYWRFDDSGRAWFGRGYVQLTHRDNYVKAATALGVDLIGNPNLALDPGIAAKILVRGMREGWFTGHKMADYLPGDYKGARRIVNGTDRAASIARLASGYEAALRAFEPVSSQSPSSGFLRRLWAWLVAWLRRISRVRL